MPFRDGTGPLGTGPIGRRLGPCGGYGRGYYYEAPYAAYGYSRYGFGRGYGAGFGRGYGRGYGRWGW